MQTVDISDDRNNSGTIFVPQREVPQDIPSPFMAVQPGLPAIPSGPIMRVEPPAQAGPQAASSRLLFPDLYQQPAEPARDQSQYPIAPPSNVTFRQHSEHAPGTIDQLQNHALFRRWESPDSRSPSPNDQALGGGREARPQPPPDHEVALFKSLKPSDQQKLYTYVHFCAEDFLVAQAAYFPRYSVETLQNLYTLAKSDVEGNNRALDRVMRGDCGQYSSDRLKYLYNYTKIVEFKSLQYDRMKHHLPQPDPPHFIEQSYKSIDYKYIEAVPDHIEHQYITHICQKYDLKDIQENIQKELDERGGRQQHVVT